MDERKGKVPSAPRFDPVPARTRSYRATDAYWGPQSFGAGSGSIHLRSTGNGTRVSLVKAPKHYAYRIKAAYFSGACFLAGSVAAVWSLFNR